MSAPIGFVVEGDTEHAAFERIIRRGFQMSCGQLPIVNAGGNGTLRKYMEDKLVDVVKAGHPRVVIVTLDLKEALRENRYADCAALRHDLQRRADDWLVNQHASGSLSPLPSEIVVIIQTPKLEAWLAADPHAPTSTSTNLGAPAHDLADVDAEIANHARWLGDTWTDGYDKSPTEALRVLRHAHPVRMAAHSRSFRKFWKHVCSACVQWHNGATCVAQAISP